MRKLCCLLLLLSSIGLPAQPKQAALTLPDAIQLALEKNFQIQIARNNLLAADINNNWGTAGFLPVIAATANKTLASNNLQQNLTNGTIIKRDGASVNNLNAGLGLTWRVFDGMRVFATKKRLEELEKLGEHELRRQMNELAFQVATTYLTGWSVVQQQAATQEVIRFNAERLKLAEEKFKAGTLARPDVLQAEIDLNEQKAILLTLENSYRQIIFSLNQLITQDPATPIQLSDSLPSWPTLVLADILAKTDTQNPQVLAAKTNLAILWQTKREIHAQRLPSATLGANYNFFRNRNAAGFTLLNQSYGPQVNVGIAIPLFNGGNFKRQEKIAELDIQNQQFAEQQLRLQLQTLVQQAFSNYENGRQLAQLEKLNLNLANQNNKINLERFKLANLTALELRQTQLNYANARNRLASAQAQEALAAFELRQLSGELLPENNRKLN